MRYKMGDEYESLSLLRGGNVLNIFIMYIFHLPFESLMVIGGILSDLV